MASSDWTGTGAVAGPLAAQSDAAICQYSGATNGWTRRSKRRLRPPNAAIMNNAALRDQIMGSNTFGGGGGRTPISPPRPSPGGFGFNPLAFFGAGPWVIGRKILLARSPLPF